MAVAKVVGAIDGLKLCGCGCDYAELVHTLQAFKCRACGGYLGFYRLKVVRPYGPMPKIVGGEPSPVSKLILESFTSAAFDEFMKATRTRIADLFRLPLRTEGCTFEVEVPPHHGRIEATKEEADEFAKTRLIPESVVARYANLGETGYPIKPPTRLQLVQGSIGCWERVPDGET